MQTLEVISVNLWQMLASLVNLVLLFLIVKRFLYRPVKKMLSDRRAAIEGDYAAADAARKDAEADRAAYEQKLKDAHDEAEGLIQSAVRTAGQREEEILAEAKDKADGILRQAKEDAALEKKKAEDEIRYEIVQVSSLLTEKILEREIRPEDHEKWIDSFVNSVGEDHDAT